MYPISYEVDFKANPNRWTTFFRLILAIPWLIVAIFWGILLAITHFISWVAIIVLGRYPQWLFDFNSGVVRFSMRLNGWLYLQADEWPPFGLSDDPSYPIRVGFAPPAPRQSRLKALFRVLLALPVALVLSYGTGYIVLAASFVAWLTIVFRGYMPEAVNGIITYCLDFQTRVTGYIVFLTDDYPPVGLEAAKSALVAPPTNPAPPPSAPIA